MINSIFSRKTDSLFALVCISIILFSNSCTSNYPTHIIDDNSINNVDLSDSSFDVEVISIKSPVPMKSINDYYSFGNHLFLVSSDCGTIYHVEGDSVVSILDKKGRGRQEYLRVQCLAYSERDSILFVKDIDSEKILKFQGVNNKVVDVFKVEENVDIFSFNQIDDNELLASCYIEPTDLISEESAGLYRISSNNGELLEELIPLDYLSYGYLETQDFTQNEENLIFQIPGPEHNQIISYNDGQITEVYSFEYSKKWRIPEKAYKNCFKDEKAKFDFAMYRANNDFCIGANMPLFINDTLSFWSFPHTRDENIKPVLNVCHDGLVFYYSNFKIQGTNIEIEPCFVWKDKYACFIEGDADEYIEEDDQMSTLGRQILDALDNNDGNPIVVLFNYK